jgi:divalent metal cation (Fe/Co/Zn/Cd) transporter
MSEAVASLEAEPMCPMCQHEVSQLFDFQCCQQCLEALRPAGRESEDGVAPCFVSSAVLEEASIAIASSPPDGCLPSHRGRGTNKYYTSLHSWLDMMNELNEITHESMIPRDENEASFGIRCATYLSFVINFCLLVGKAVALSTSTSYTLISSLADSCLDLIAGTIIAYTAAKSKFTREDLLKYPVGKSRVSTVGILVFSCLMACCAVYIILQCGLALLRREGASGNTVTALVVMATTIGVKLTMAILYYCLRHPMTVALAKDHRNDFLTNSLGLFMYWGSDHLGWWMDSAGGMALAAFVLVSWALNAFENGKMLTGAAAPPEIVRALTYLAAHHHPFIIAVEQVIAFQIGPQYFAELHIIVPGHIRLEVAHWIGESLQLKVERVQGIERAWVHVDCEAHNENEHVLLMRATGKLNHVKTLGRRQRNPESDAEDHADSDQRGTTPL